MLGPIVDLLAAAQAYHKAGHHPFGGVFTSQHGTDLAALTGMEAEVSALRREKLLDLAGYHGFEIIAGHGRFTDPDTIDAGRSGPAGS